MQLNLLFYLIFCLILFPEGLGLPFGREITLGIIIIAPIFLLSLDLIYKKPVQFPVLSSCLYGFFLLLSIIAAFFGEDLTNSAKTIALYTGGFLFFIYAYNHSGELTKSLLNFIHFAAYVFIFYCVFLFFYQGILVPSNGYQFVYSRFGSHNHLGDFLVLALLVVTYLYFESKKVRYFFIFLLFFASFLTAYSRSAYFTFLIAEGWLLFYLIKSKRIHLNLPNFVTVAGFLLIILFFFFAVVIQTERGLPFLRSTNYFLHENLNLENKYLFATRPEYFRQALRSIQENSLLGVGPGNFYLSSAKYKSIKKTTYSSHNIFLDIMVENGIIAFIFFLAFLFLVIKSAFHKANIYLILAIALLINFQTDYTHTIYSFLIFFFFLLGIIYNSKKIDGIT